MNEIAKLMSYFAGLIMAFIGLRTTTGKESKGGWIAINIMYVVMIAIFMFKNIY